MNLKSNFSEYFLAIDLGAESGRAILGRQEGSFLRIEEIHRFLNGPVWLNDHLYWDILAIWSEIQKGLRLASSRCGNGLISIGLDTWGVDFGLLDSKDALIGNPFHYRDKRTDGMIEQGDKLISREEIYNLTGNQFMQLNSLYQLLSMKLSHDPALDTARTFLNLPDLINFWLTDRKGSEFTISTTTQCFNPRKKEWSRDLLSRMSLPTDIFQEIIEPGTTYNPLRSNLAQALGISGVQVAAIASHDTASAVVAVPAEVRRYAFISSGTWSLVGTEIPEPIINYKSQMYDFTNEGCFGGNFRFLKNIPGLWLLQECRRDWASKDIECGYEEIVHLASQVEAFRTLLNPNDPCFLSPGDMPARIRQFARSTNQPVPETVGAVVRCTLESLALSYRQVIENLEDVLGYKIEVVHIVGGGSRNRLLNQFTASATGYPVIAGPVEATAVGNILVQEIAMGRVATLSEARNLVRSSFDMNLFEPGEKQAWDDAYQKWLNLLNDLKLQTSQ